MFVFTLIFSLDICSGFSNCVKETIYIYIYIYMYTIFYKRFIDDYVIFEICLMASKSARMRGSAHLKAVTVAHQKSYVIYIMSII